MKTLWINKSKIIKRSIISFSICYLVASFGIAANQLVRAANEDMQLEKNATENSRKTSTLSIEDFRHLKKGMSRADFLKQMGSPEKKVGIGSGRCLYIYSLTDGSEMRVGFSGSNQLLFIDHKEKVL
jgi:hypothetical protein